MASFTVLRKIKHALGFGQTRGFFYGAAPLKRSTVEFFASLDMPLMNIYGLSESSGPLTTCTINKFNFDTIGVCLEGVEVKIDHPDENGIGEICGRGRNIMMGYFKNEEATKEAIDQDGWFHTGDRGRIDESKLLYVTGRIKELIITAGGENIGPVPIEDTFKSFCPMASNIMVVGEN